MNCVARFLLVSLGYVVFLLAFCLGVTMLTFGGFCGAVSLLSLIAAWIGVVGAVVAVVGALLMITAFVLTWLLFVYEQHLMSVCGQNPFR